MDIRSAYDEIYRAVDAVHDAQVLLKAAMDAARDAGHDQAALKTLATAALDVKLEALGKKTQSILYNATQLNLNL